MERSKLSSRSVICVFLGYGEGKKGYRCFDPITQKLYVSRHVVFLEHIPFFSIPSTTHALTRSDLVRIDPFSEDSDSLSSQVPSTSNTPSHVLPPLPLHYTRRIRTDHSAGTDTLLSGTPEASSSPMVHQAPSEVVDPPLRQSICIHCRFLYQVAFYFPFSFSSWQTLDACSCRIMQDAKMLLPEEVSNPKPRKKKPLVSVFQPERSTLDSLLDSSRSGNEYPGTETEVFFVFYQTETEVFTVGGELCIIALGRELREVEDEVKTLEDEKLALLDQLVVLEGLIDPSDLQSQGPPVL
ncbi:hypothetical protein HHK36_008855 [Tetracentron sinense]|uniref:Retroviral polymerase SH3-like domain-containing protein n=1 Tax=Tetracentron sinense TaxID=13715 RepID=A0A834ZK90_TETSI|nr:hypothetical protein HHK36_008855 [Tetracentron sinense]